ncbi:MAG TPA: polyphosphate polymerase domain-containing protein [Thermomicrobiales bacterium]|nr:polyphosphate polymerase domain-containing protein [Thermomicrobiales bacterium]
MKANPSMMEGLNSLPSISLDDLQRDAAFLTRADRKYVMPASEIGRLLDTLDPETSVLEIDGSREFRYFTPYFDTDHLDAYRNAAKRRPNRFKVRTRLYVDSGLRQLEVKVRDARGLTVKHRIEHAASPLELLTEDERDWLREFPQVQSSADRLGHCLTTLYRRRTLVLPDGLGRVTIDSDLEFALPDGTGLILPHHAVVETKGAGRPTPVDRRLWRLGYRPVSCSKYAMGIALLFPNLPGNRWHRLRMHLHRAAEVRRPPITEGFIAGGHAVLNPAP